MAGLPLSLNIVLRIASLTVSLCYVLCLQAVHIQLQDLHILCTCHFKIKLCKERDN